MRLAEPVVLLAKVRVGSVVHPLKVMPRRHLKLQRLLQLALASGHELLDVAATLGLNRDALLAALADETVKDKLKLEVETAIARGVFGSPYFIVDDEPFWGADRLEQLERWLADGPF